MNRKRKRLIKVKYEQPVRGHDRRDKGLLLENHKKDKKE